MVRWRAAVHWNVWVLIQRLWPFFRAAVFWGRCRIWSTKKISWEQLRLMGVQPRAVWRLSRREGIRLGAVGLLFGLIVFWVFFCCWFVHCRDTSRRSHTYYQAKARLWFAVAQETKERLRASLEENCQEGNGLRQPVCNYFYSVSELICVNLLPICLHHFEITSLVCIKWKLKLHLRTLKLFGIFSWLWPASESQKCTGLEQPGLVEVIPVHSRRLDWMAFKGPSQPKPVCGSTPNLVVWEGAEQTQLCLVQLPCSAGRRLRVWHSCHSTTGGNILP